VTFRAVSATKAWLFQGGQKALCILKKINPSIVIFFTSFSLSFQEKILKNITKNTLSHIVVLSNGDHKKYKKEAFLLRVFKPAYVMR
jgi:hypothetical protein